MTIHNVNHTQSQCNDAKSIFGHAIDVVPIDSSRSYALLLLMISIVIVPESYILFEFTFHCTIML